MSGTVAVRDTQGGSMAAKIEYARELANSGLLPSQYRKQPANVLYAVEYGDMLGLSPMAAITGIHIIEGKPSASAGLISALVRRAGHTLRVTGNNESATCVIIRADDPGNPFSVTWTLRPGPDKHPDAQTAGLLNKGTWKSYPASMLKSRVITQCARDACEEALYGLHYTPEELGAEVDEDGAVLATLEPAAASRQVPAATERAAGTPDDDPFYVRPAGDAAGPEAWDPQAWLAGMHERAAGFATKDAGTDLWKETALTHRRRHISDDDRRFIEGLITARLEDLEKQAAATAQDADAEVVDGVIVPGGAADRFYGLEPEDEWAAAVQSIMDADDARAARANLHTATMPREHRERIAAAIEARWAELDGTAAA